VVRDPASRSWSPARLSGARGPAGAMSAAVRKDLALNLSAVHENIRGRASKRFRNWFRVKASGSIGPMCFSLGGYGFAAPPSSSAMSPVGYSLAVALQQSPPLRRPLPWWCRFRLRSTGKYKPGSRADASCCRRQNRQYCGCFIPALTP